MMMAELKNVEDIMKQDETEIKEKIKNVNEKKSSTKNKRKM